jgi:hypothetical protein
VILAALIGWSLRFAGFEHAILPAVLIGLLVAPFVPVRGACAVPDRERAGPRR